MRITWDRQTNAAYLYLTDDALSPGRQSLSCEVPPDAQGAWVVMDWKDGKIVGLEVLNASALLHPGLLAQAPVEH